MNELSTTVFVEQPLTFPGSAINNIGLTKTMTVDPPNNYSCPYKTVMVDPLNNDSGPTQTTTVDKSKQQQWTDKNNVEEPYN